MKNNGDWKRVSVDLRGDVLERFNEYMNGRRIRQTQACTELIEAGLNELTSRGMNGFPCFVYRCIPPFYHHAQTRSFFAQC